MTSLIPDTSPAHARHIRVLTAALTSPSSTIPPYLLANPPFHTLTSQTLPPFLNLLLSSLTKSECLPISLKLTTLLLRFTPALVINPHLPSISQKLTPLLKPPHVPCTRAKALACLATLLAQPHLQPPHRTNLTQSALTHAMRALTDPLPPLVLSALATLLSAVQTAPRELRSSLPTLDLTIPNLFTHPKPQIRHAAAELYSQILIVKPQAAVQPAFEHQLHFVTARMDDVHHLLERFTPALVAPRRLHSDVLPMSAVQMAHFYEVLCRVLCAMLRLSTRVAVPAAPLLHSLMGGLAHVEVDGYANVDGCVLDADGALWVGICVVKEALRALRDVIRGLGRVLLPYAGIVARAVERRLVRELLRFRKEGGTVGYEERKLMYELIGAAVEVFGGVFVERISDVFVEVFEMETVFYGRCLESARRKVEKVSVLECGKRKRRRQGRQIAEEQTDEAEKERTADTVGVAIMEEVETNVEEGLGVCIAVFENRGMLSNKTVETLEKLEFVLTRLAEGSVSDKLMEAMRAAALGGGASRLRAEASPLLMQCAEKATEFMLEGTLGKRKRVALQTRSACETVFHPRGPPILRSIPYTHLIQGTDSATPSKLHKHSANTVDQLIVRNDKRNDGDSEMGLKPNAPDTIPNGSLQRQREGSVEILEVEHRQEQGQSTGASPGSSVRDKNDDVVKEAYTSSLRSPQKDIVVDKRITISKTVLQSTESKPFIVELEQQDKNSVQFSSRMQTSPSPMPKTSAVQSQSHGVKESSAPPMDDRPDDDVLENRVRDTGKDGEAEGNGQQLTPETEEQALIASLRFEPPDEE